MRFIEDTSMLKNLRIALIGAGAMGEAMIGGLLRHELIRPDQMMATAPRAERRAELQTRYSIAVSDNNEEAAHWGQVVIFAVKPQTLPRVLAPLRAHSATTSCVFPLSRGYPSPHSWKAWNIPL